VSPLLLLSTGKAFTPPLFGQFGKKAKGE